MASAETYKTIKVPKWVYENAKEVELLLMRKGVENLPAKVLSPQECPICSSTMESDQGDDGYVRCERCGYTQQKFDAKVNGIVLGTAIGMGLIYLLNIMFGRE